MKDDHLRAVNKVKDNNPFRLRIMGKKYTGIRAKLWDVGLLNPNSKLNKKVNKKVNTSVKAVSAKLKNVWKQYKSGDVKGTVPWVWKKTGVSKMASNLKNINKN